MLQDFTRDEILKDVCLGHIFTYNQFKDDDGFVLGLAYVASPEEDGQGGICSSGKYPTLPQIFMLDYEQGNSYLSEA